MKSAIVAVLGLALAVGVGRAQDGSGSREFLRLEWQPVRGGRPMIAGYVENRHDFWAVDIRLLVEALDATGRPVGRTVGDVEDDVPPGGWTYFEVHVGTPGERYRVTLLDFDWRVRGRPEVQSP